MEVIEDFVPFQMAIKLKEKGLTLSKGYIFGAYDEDGDLFSMLEYNIEEYWCAYAPTITQSLKWLREEKGLYVDISLYKKGYCTLIYETNFPDGKDYANSWRVNNTYNTYEEAANAGIEYVINNLI